MFFHFHLICETKVTKRTSKINTLATFHRKQKVFPLLVDNLKSEDYFYAQKRNMKKKTVLKLLFITSCLVAVCSLFYNNETSTLDSLAFQNVEALAQGENDDDAHCYGYGSVDCRSYKVKYKISGLSLE